ncbi:MAG: class II SORL domain-containing protein [Candidatus Brocadiia bacterium]
MAKLGEKIQTEDYMNEKHVPVIECPEQVESGEMFEVKVSLGKAIAHPNTTEHHIRWIELHFHPEGEDYVHDVGRFEFNSHGEGTDGPNKGAVHTHHCAAAMMQTTSPGTLHALAYCNIHGLWESSRELPLK